jgi:hypothetical protein
MTYIEALDSADKSNKNLRRKKWPADKYLTKIWARYSFVASNIKVQTKDGVEYWRPDHYDLIATDWELI